MTVKLDVLIKEYKLGLNIRDIAAKHNVSYEYVRKNLKNKVQWRKKYISDFTNDQVKKAISMFDSGQSIKEIAKWFEISAPAISRLLRANNRIPDSSARRYNHLRAIPINYVQKQILVGMLLGDGCLYRDGKNSLYKLSFGHCKKQKQYFHWKISMLDPFVNAWRENIDKRKNSIMLQTATICHQGLNSFADMFYDNQRIKHIPDNLDIYMTPLALAVWICDDGNLNSGINMRIATMGFTYEENIKLQNLLKRCFDLRSKVMGFKFKEKEYFQLTLNKKNTQKLSDIIRPHVIDSMKYKIMPESSETNMLNSKIGEDRVRPL